MSEDVKLRDYQVADLAFYMMNPRCANLSDPGTGKTPSVCVYGWYLWDEKREKTAWAMPKSLLVKNKEELVRFTPFKPEDVVVIDGTPAQREAQIRDPKGKIFLMGFKRFSDDWEKICNHHDQMNALFVDEFHLGYSTNGSKRTQAMYNAMRRLKYFLPMTGTMIRGRLNSAYPAIHVIEPRYYGNERTFMAQHAIYDDWGSVIGWQNHAKLAMIFGKHAIRHSFEDIFGKEEKVIIPEVVEMSKEQREAYDEFHEKALLELEDTFLEGATGGVFVMRCRQLAGHPHTFGLCKNELTGKQERLKIHLADHQNTGEPLVIFGTLIAEIERIAEICQKEGLKTGMIHGGVPSPKRSQIDQAFRSGQIQVMVASPLTAGIGYNWEHCNHVMFASMDYMDDSFFQGYRRCIRGIRTKPLRITVLQYADSVDQPIFGIVKRKSEDAAKVDPTREVVDLFARKERTPVPGQKLAMDSIGF